MSLVRFGWLANIVGGRTATVNCLTHVTDILSMEALYGIGSVVLTVAVLAAQGRNRRRRGARRDRRIDCRTEGGETCPGNSLPA